MKLEIDDFIEVEIYAGQKWNVTGIDISENEQYEFTTAGIWKDLTIQTDANGYTNLYMKMFDIFKRSRNNKWFALMGCLNQQDRESFLIGTKNSIVFSDSGFLSCFANDVNGFYFNNSGSLKLKIHRLK